MSKRMNPLARHAIDWLSLLFYCDSTLVFQRVFSYHKKPTQSTQFFGLPAMTGRPQTYSTRLLVRWADFVGHHSALVLFLSFLATAGVLIYTVNHFRIDTEMSDMISSNLPYRKLEKEFQTAFPQLKDTIVVVIDADTPENARLQRDKLVQRLKQETGLFRGVYSPGSGEYFERNGFLYLTVKDLEALSENLAKAQPLLGLISRDLSLQGFFSVVETIVTQNGNNGYNTNLVSFFDRLAEAIREFSFESAETYFLAGTRSRERTGGGDEASVRYP